MKPASNKADGIRMALIDGIFMNRVMSLEYWEYQLNNYLEKRLNEIVPVSHPIFWFGTILTQKSNNKNYSNGVNRILTIKIIPTMPKPIK